MSDRLDDPPVLELLGEQVRMAAARAEQAGTARRRWWSRPPRILALLVLLVLPTAAASAGATLLALRGSVIPVPRATPVEQTSQPGTNRLVATAARDPLPGRPVWTLRLATSPSGLLCSTVGQLVGGAFGIVGLDGRFRALAGEAADACSIRRANAASLVGARVFDADAPGEIRTVVSGVAGDRLRAVTVEAAGARRAVPVHAGGAFLTVLAGLPEDLGVQVRLRFADGHVENHPFGVSPLVLADPAGAPAWRLESGVVSGDARTCVSLRTAREVRGPQTSPAACGELAGKGARRGIFFMLRRVTRSTASVPATPFGSGRWDHTPPRLIVLGAAGTDVAAIDVRGPVGQRVTQRWFKPNGSFAFMFGPAVRAGQVTVKVRFKDGRELVRTASTNLLDSPFPRGPR